jgi:hypothetical protein
MDQQGSIRSSGKGGKSAFKAIPIEAALLEKAKHFLESFQFDLRIRQHLHADKMENTIGKNKFFLLPNEQRFEPGYILIMKGQPIVFLQGRLQYGFILRLRIHPSLYQNQAIFVGTLNTIQSTLRLEDVLYYDGRSLIEHTYTSRYQTIDAFLSNAFVQDFRLSGLAVSAATLYPLSSLKSLVDSDLYHSIDFVPDQAKRRRLFITMQQQQQPVEKQKEEVKEEVPIQKEDRTTAIAFKIKGLPDTYELKDEKGNALGKAAVQTTEVSVLLRQAIQDSGKKVKIQWYEEFERYKIVSLLEN